MIARLEQLRKHPAVFRHLTGLAAPVFDDLAAELAPALAAADHARRARPARRRAPGAGHPFALADADQLLLTVIWLRRYPTQECLGFLFGVSDSAALRAIRRCLPVLEAAGQGTMRLPDPGSGRRRDLPALLADTPDLAVIVDTFEQRTQRPRRRQRAYYSGKKKAHTVKGQVTVDEDGYVVDVGESRPGRWSDLKVLRRSGLRRRLPYGTGLLGELGYVGIADWHPEGLGATPRRKPRGRPRSAEDRRYDRAFARRRIVVEHAIGRLRRYEALSQVDRHRREGHTARVRAVAGLVNRMLAHRQAA